MALDPVSAVRLEVGLVGEAYDLLTDDEITHYLVEFSNNISKTARRCASIALLILSQRVHEKADVLEIWGNDWFNNYYKALQLYLNDPNFNTSIGGAKPYAGGISIKDIRANVDNFDNQVVNVQIGIPTDNGVPCSWNTTQDVFKKDPFSIW